MDPVIPPSASICYFFKLSAEIRNQIYDYTLSDAAGAVCREEPHDKSGLFRFYPCAIANRNLSSKVASEDEDINNANEENNRDIISNNPVTSVNVPLEINQLKYVCHQLNVETKAIVVRTNDLIFEQGMYQLSMFLNTIPPSIEQGLRKVTVLENRKWAPSTGTSFFRERPWQDVFRYCHTHPALTAHVQLSWLNPNCEWILIFLKYIPFYTGRKVTINESDSAVKQALDIINNSARETPNPDVSSNIRIFPPSTYVEGGPFGCTGGHARLHCSKPSGRFLEVIKHAVENGL